MADMVGGTRRAPALARVSVSGTPRHLKIEMTNLLPLQPDNAAQAWASEDKYRVLLDSIDEGFCVIQMVFDGDGVAVDYLFLEANHSFERQTGLVDVIGQRIRHLTEAHEEYWFRTYGDVARSGRPVRFEAPAQALGRWYDVYAFRVSDPAHHQVAVLFNDISQRKRAEIALQEADRRKDEFLAILAHELRNPLAPLRNGLQIMARQVDQLVSLVDDLLDVSRISRGQVELVCQPTDMVAVIHQAVEASESSILDRRHEFSLQLPSCAVRVNVDVMRMAQALTNLLLNAAKYTAPGGRVSLTLAEESSQAVICIADSGVGIPSHMLEKVFELFTQVESAHAQSQGGLGIGLSLVKQIVSMHGGSVRADSAGPGEGSRFTVRIPLAPAAAPVNG
jgi:signal transduction histidine kinase